ncbi:putative NLR family CARD domain-containing protein 4 [Apostichopus japonicus]|uniref:Putative NLR family CARD domain-containing protein 4 n=1 Tax=Stichopus japonicus TaxID=307972 RepID=A0A2G8KTL4_STIJA|nr:putative NLR family CARD domain-containing protein 4 [Apostichopus japonicus]
MEWLVLTLIFITTVNQNRCNAFQYLEIGKRGTIKCSVNGTFNAVLWYISNEEEAVAVFKESEKSGEGYERGEYDIDKDGSLVILNVTTQHDKVFRVKQVIQLTERYVEHTVVARTTVAPDTSYPVITNCEMTNNVCFKQVDKDNLFDCVVQNTRPAVELNWISASTTTDDITTSSVVVAENNVTYTTQSTLSYSYRHYPRLSIFTCQAFSVAPNMMATSSTLIIEKTFDFSSLVATQKYIEMHSKLDLDCTSDINYSILVWKKSSRMDGIFENILYSINDGTHYFTSGYEFGTAGNLSVSEVAVKDEGFFVCLYTNGLIEGMKLYNVSVYVYPSPLYPVIEECKQRGNNCTVYAKFGDSLTCTIHRIRPKVHLVLQAYQKDSPVTFELQQLFVEQNGESYDVSISSVIQLLPQYEYSFRESRVTVECRVIGPYEDLVYKSSKLDLLLPSAYEESGNTGVPLEIRRVIFIIAAVGLFLFLIILGLSCVLRKGKRQTKNEGNDVTSKHEEDIELLQVNDAKEEEDKTSKGDEVKMTPEQEIDRFISHIEKKYQKLYNSVETIPYVRDRMRCVDNIFVDSGIMIRESNEESKSRKLESYEDIFDNENMENSRIFVIEGEPGYGKSTLARKILYDWCHDPSFRLSSVNILIFLPMRQLGGTNSIFEAIRKLLLQGSEPWLNEIDVEGMLRKPAMPSVLILLDGYDEYPDRDTKYTYIEEILQGRQLEHLRVMVTTRLSYMTDKYLRKSLWVRLTGFDEKAGQTYITKSVFNSNMKKGSKFMDILQSNSILKHLSKVPLFFVMFAHMTHEDKTFKSLTSVTEVFKKIVSSFHVHMKAKLLNPEEISSFEHLQKFHDKLDEIAFEWLLNGTNQLKAVGIKLKLGKDLYNHYVKIGILVEESSDCFGNAHGGKIVRFFHKIFCEWYAAHYLANHLSARGANDLELLQGMDPMQLQHVFRFACGLSKVAGEKIIKYLEGIVEGKTFAIVCMAEHDKTSKRFNETLEALTSSGKTYIHGRDSNLLQWSTVCTLEAAGSRSIRIECIVLDQAFARTEEDGIVLTSGTRLPPISTLEAIWIETEDGREFSDNDVGKVLSYMSQSKRTKTVHFQNCLLPMQISKIHLKSSDGIKTVDAKVLERMKSETTKLKKIRNKINHSDTDFDEKKPHTTDGIIKSNKPECINNKNKQRSLIQLLHIASRKKVIIKLLSLYKSYRKVDKDKIVLESGISLPNFGTAERVQVDTEIGGN